MCLWPDGYHRCGLGALARDASGSLALSNFAPSCDEGGDELSASLRPLPVTIWRRLSLRCHGAVENTSTTGGRFLLFYALSNLRNPEINASGVHCST